MCRYSDAQPLNIMLGSLLPTIIRFPKISIPNALYLALYDDVAPFLIIQSTIFTEVSVF